MNGRPMDSQYVQFVVRKSQLQRRMSSDFHAPLVKLVMMLMRYMREEAKL